MSRRLYYGPAQFLRQIRLNALLFPQLQIGAGFRVVFFFFFFYFFKIA